MLYTLKHFKIPFFKKQLLNLVTLCHGFCISYGLAHALSNFQLLTVSSIPFQSYKYCKFPPTGATSATFLVVLTSL